MPLRTLSIWPPAVTISLAIALGLLAWWLYRRESSSIGGSLGWILPTLRAVAIALIALTLAEPAWQTVSRVGTPGTIVFVLDRSQSMTLTDSSSSSLTSETTDPNRLERATATLLAEGTGLLAQVADRFDVQAFTIGGGGEPVEVPLEARAGSWRPAAWTMETRAGDCLAELARQANQRVADTVIVLLSDGRNNAGMPLTQAAADLESASAPLFAIGYGASSETDDLVLKKGLTANRVYREDMLSGSMVVSENLPSGRDYRAQVLYKNQVMWNEQFTSIGATDRELEFNFPVAELLDVSQQASASQVEYANLPARLDLRLLMEDEENIANNARALYTTVTAQQAKILLIDERSRWETRYLRNMFSRDPAWQIVTAIAANAGSGTSLEASSKLANELPASRDELFEFNLVILGDIGPTAISQEFRTWLREFVEDGRGGLILIDGARRNLASSEFKELNGVFPVRWNAATDVSNSLFAAALTPEGKDLTALRLSDERLSIDTWKALPSLPFVVEVSALPGAEVLAVAEAGDEKRPLLVSRRFGGGRVLYVATDELWRWRYKVADLIHTRLWNQLARWMMRKPLSLRSEFLSLDTGSPNYAPGELIEIQCELRNASGRADSKQSPVAVVYRAETVVARLPLSELADYPGRYRVTTDRLAVGDYSVRIEAAGYPQQALALESRLSVTATDNLEFQETTCNENLLRNVCQQTGGEYFHESEVSQIANRLRPLSDGKIQMSTIMIWQSYGWFAGAILLLLTEWILRKRAGLI